MLLTPGLNVITGETGAGKTVLTSALDLLLGGKPKANLVRPGASEAYVEGVFDLGDELRDELGDRIPDDAEELVIARRISAEGRTRAYVSGRTTTVGELREVAETLLSFYGQHEHRKLTVGASQLNILDGFCGAKQIALRATCATEYERVKELNAKLIELATLDEERARDVELLTYELEEIDQVAPDENEETELLAERERLQHLEGLRGGSLTAARVIDPDSDEVGAASLLATGLNSLESVEGIDSELDSLTERYRGLQLEAVDLAAELQRYVESVDAPPGRLEEIETRLQQFDDLKRKHGGSVQSVLAHAEHCRLRLGDFTDAEAAIAQATKDLEAANTQLAKIARGLTKSRREAADALTKAVDSRLTELAMEGARFTVEISPRDEIAATGGDQVEFMLQANPGVAAGALRDTASGGELSRTMLALLGVANEEGRTTLVFDEIDSGIGGHTANAVGESLARLATNRQVLLITHLPQIAALTDGHFTIEKDLTVTPATTRVTKLGDEEAVIDELVRMLGADSSDSAAREHAADLRSSRLVASAR